MLVHPTLVAEQGLEVVKVIPFISARGLRGVNRPAEVVRHHRLGGVGDDRVSVARLRRECWSVIRISEGRRQWQWR